MSEFNIEPGRQPIGFETPSCGRADNKTAYRGKDYPVHSTGPWSVTVGCVPDREGRLIVEDCHGNPVCATSARGVQGRVPIMEANAKLIAASPEMLEVLRWLDNEMDCRYHRALESSRPYPSRPFRLRGRSCGARPGNSRGADYERK